MGTINRGYQTGGFSKPVMKQKVQPKQREQKLIERRKSKIDNRSELDLDTYIETFFTSSSTTTGLEPGALWSTTTTADSRYVTSTTTTGAIEGYISKAALESKLNEVEEKTKELDQSVKLLKAGVSYLQEALSELHIKFLELEHSNLQVTEPFTYRVQKNVLDELYEEVLELFEELKEDPNNVSIIKHKLKMKGLL